MVRPCNRACPSRVSSSTPAPTPGAWWEGTGRHACFDRLVIDIANGTEPPGYTVEYVPAFTQDGSGAVIPLRGAADLQVIVRAPAYDGGGDSTIGLAAGDRAVGVSGFRTLREVVFGGSFEGSTQFGVGVRARLPFRVFRLASAPGDDASTRLVIDVAHRW